VRKAAIKLRKRGARAAPAHVPAPKSNFADSDERPLHRCVENALDAYFDALDGETATGLFDLVMAEVERPMLASVMRHVGGNQCRAAEVLGLSRGTLRKKLVQHGLLED
jgi:Fis family transcriptional regulator, factor for inversion stimulation protein